MKINWKTEEPHLKKQLEFVGIALKEIRRSNGKRQIDYKEEGISRRQIQRAETGNNISLKKLLYILDCYGYTLTDVDLNSL